MGRSKIFFSLIGAVALVLLVRDYGWSTLTGDLKTAGHGLGLLVLTFVPTLLCYSIAWLLSTAHISFTPRNLFFFTWASASSIAWNNLTPFLKVGGEVVKVQLLEKKIPRRDAIESVVVYNLAHALGTVGSFALGALLLPVFFDLGDQLRKLSFGIGGIGALALLFLSLLPLLGMKMVELGKFPFLRNFFLEMHRTLEASHHFAKNHKWRWGFSITLEVTARFIEGITFYYAFYLLQKPISISVATFLEVGRSLADTAMFFIPYNFGSREMSVKFLLEHAFHIPAQGYFTAVLFYRFVEIVWIILGYGFWILSGQSRRALTTRQPMSDTPSATP